MQMKLKKRENLEKQGGEFFVYIAWSRDHHKMDAPPPIERAQAKNFVARVLGMGHRLLVKTVLELTDFVNPTNATKA